MVVYGTLISIKGRVPTTVEYVSATVVCVGLFHLLGGKF
jgi:hypothetical protein